MASAQVVETSVTNNSPSQDSYHPDDLFQSRYVTPGFKPFSYDVFPRKVSNAQEKVRGMLKAEFFVSVLLKLSLNNNSKREINFF